MTGNALSFAVLAILAVATALVLHALVRESLRHLLDEVIRLPAATVFYTRLLLIGLLFIALAATLGVKFDLGSQAAFMEYVWKVAEGLSAVFGRACIFLATYLALVTVLVAVLRNRHE
jgi:hypothetical protein